jgi:hypothetical protein
VQASEQQMKLIEGATKLPTTQVEEQLLKVHKNLADLD